MESQHEDLVKKCYKEIYNKISQRIEQNIGSLTEKTDKKFADLAETFTQQHKTIETKFISACTNMENVTHVVKQIKEFALAELSNKISSLTQDLEILQTQACKDKIEVQQKFESFEYSHRKLVEMLRSFTKRQDKSGSFALIKQSRNESVNNSTIHKRGKYSAFKEKASVTPNDGKSKSKMRSKSGKKYSTVEIN